MSRVLRILDANANRAREALRVMEEAARFVLDDAELSGQLKSLRHELVTALSSTTDLSFHRDTPGDVGTDIKSAHDLPRRNAADVVIAAGKRLCEAMRCIEEYGKILPDPGAASLATRIEQLRYRGYDIEKRLTRAMGTGRSRQWRLCVLLTESICHHHKWSVVLDAAIESGADCIQLREKNLDGQLLLKRAREVVGRCHRAGVSVIINDRPDVALLSHADGVHLGQTDLPCGDVRKMVGRQLLIGVSTSNLGQAETALRDGADYCGLGPMFPTTTKHKPDIVGPPYAHRFLDWGKLPHLAIGGITPDNVGKLARAGVRGVAVSSCICSARDPVNAGKCLLAELSVCE